MSPARLAIWLMIAQGALFAAETLIIHHLESRVSIMQVALIRGAGGVALALILAKSIGAMILHTRQLPLQLLRGGVSLLYLWVMIYSFGALPFADATAISYTQVAYIAVFAVLILGEPVSAPRWAAAGIGIVGALLIANPSFDGWHGAYLVVVFGTGLNGLAFVLNRYLQREDSEATTMLYTNLVLVVGNLPILLTAGTPSIDTFPLLSGMLLFGPIGMYMGIIAVKHAEASVLAPYTLLRLVIGAVAGLVVFREVPHFFSAAGAILILASCLLAAHLSCPRRASMHRPGRTRQTPLVARQIAS